MSSNSKKTSEETAVNPSNLLTKRPVIDNWCFTKVKVVEYNYAWTVDNFRWCNTINLDLVSPKFSVGSDQFYLQLTLKNNPDYMGIHLIGNIIETVVEMSILNFRLEKTNIKKGYAGMSYPNFIRRDVLLNEVNLLLPDDKLTIFCEFKKTLKTENICSISVEETKERLVAPDMKLSRDFANILNNETLSDVIFAIDGRELRAHKVILAARSSVFAAMFEHDMEESKVNRVNVTDVNIAVFKEMLSFIYTGQVQNLNGLAAGLFSASDKYALENLKKICATFLFKNLEVESAAEILKLADLHSDEYLKNQIIKFFIKAHATEVTKTQGWKSLIKSQPQLIDETFQLLMNKYPRNCTYSLNFKYVCLIVANVNSSGNKLVPTF